MRKFLCIIFTFAAVSFSLAQPAVLKLAVGVGLTSNVHAGHGNFLGSTLRGTFNIFKSGTIYLGFNRTISKEFWNETEGVALNSSTSPKYINVRYTNRITLSELNAGFQLFSFGTTNKDPFGFYIHAGAGIVIAEVATKADPYDHQYIIYIKDGKTTDTGFTINAGIGIQVRIGRGHLFLEPKLSLPAKQFNGEYVENSVLVSVGALFGYKVYFGKDD